MRIPALVRSAVPVENEHRLRMALLRSSEQGGAGVLAMLVLASGEQVHVTVHRLRPRRNRLPTTC